MMPAAGEVHEEAATEWSLPMLVSSHFHLASAFFAGDYDDEDCKGYISIYYQLAALNFNSHRHYVSREDAAALTGTTEVSPRALSTS